MYRAVPQFIRTTACWQVVKKYFFYPTPRLEARMIPLSTSDRTRDLESILEPLDLPSNARRCLHFRLPPPQNSSRSPTNPSRSSNRRVQLPPESPPPTSPPASHPVTQFIKHPDCHLASIARKWLGSYPVPATALPRGAARCSSSQLNCMLPRLKSQEN